MFEVKALKKSYKVDFWSKPIEVLKDVSFEVSKGEIVGFLGVNGAGKTTLIKIMMQFTSCDSGSIKFFSNKCFEQVSGLVGYLPERPYFYPHLTGREMISYMGELCNLSKEEIDISIEKYAKRLKIDFALDRKIKGYSKGMLQRLGFVCTLVHDPELLIFDEPLSGLDPIGRKEFKDLMVELNRQGKTIFFSSHIVSDVEEVCRSVVVLDKGSIVYKGDIDSLLLSEATDLTRIVVNKELTSNSKYTIFNKKEGLVTYEIKNVEKKDFLKMTLVEDIEVVSLETKLPSLEEIVYKTGSIE